MIPNKYSPLEQYLRDLPVNQEEAVITFEQIERILKTSLPTSAREDASWWGNQAKGFTVEIISWMNAGWLVDQVNLWEKWVKFVRQ
jgi:hypothetical protein